MSKNIQALQEQINNLWAYINKEAHRLSHSEVLSLYRQLDSLTAQLNAITNPQAHAEAQKEAKSREKGEW